jgi:hypothetical protein
LDPSEFGPAGGDEVARELTTPESEAPEPGSSTASDDTLDEKVAK